MAINLEREGVALNAEERNKRNSNLTKIEQGLNEAVKAVPIATEAKEIAETAEGKVDNVQTQLNTFVVEGDSSPQATQASVGADGTEYGGSLKARLDTEHNKVTAQLADKLGHGEVAVSDIDKNKGKFDQTFLSEDLLQQIAGNAPINATPANKGVTNSKIADKSVSVRKSDFMKQSTNHFDASRAVPGVLSTSTGELVASTSYYTTDFIETSELEKWTVNGFNRMVSYGADKNFIGVDQASGTPTYTARAGAFYLRFSIQSTPSSSSFQNAQINRGENLLPYEPYYTGIKSLKLDEQTVAVENTTFAEQGAELFNGYTEGLNRSGSNVIASSLANVFGVVAPIEEGASYKVDKGVGGNNLSILLLENDPRIAENLPVPILQMYDEGPGSSARSKVIRNEEKANFVLVVTNTNIATLPEFVSIKKTVTIPAINLESESVQENHLSSKIRSLIFKDEKPYTFSQEPLPYYRSTDTDYVKMENVNAVYSAYDTLLAAYPEYITKETVRSDASGTFPIYQYIFKPAQVDITSTGKVIPKFLLHAGIHGEERPSAPTLYHMLRDICEKWEQSETLEYLRFNAEFHVIPIVNPWGFEGGQRVNANGVNIQRNSDYSWIQDAVSGNAPFSEPETQNVRDLIVDNLDAFYYGDIHTAGTYYDHTKLFLHGMPSGDLRNDKLVTSGKFHVEKMSRELQRNYGIPSSVGLMGFMDQRNINGASRSFASANGLNASAIETFYSLTETTTDNEVIRANTELMTNWLVVLLNQFRT